MHCSIAASSTAKLDRASPACHDIDTICSYNTGSTPIGHAVSSQFQAGRASSNFWSSNTAQCANGANHRRFICSSRAAATTGGGANSQSNTKKPWYQTSGANCCRGSNCTCRHRGRGWDIFCHWLETPPTPTALRCHGPEVYTAFVGLADPRHDAQLRCDLS